MPECCGKPEACTYQASSTSIPPCSLSRRLHAGAADADPPSSFLGPAGKSSSRPAALKNILHIHNSICSALHSFREEISALRYQESTEVGTGKWHALVEKYRFLRSVCLFHTASEEEVRYRLLKILFEFENFRNF
jgi:zinc finger-like protein